MTDIVLKDIDDPKIFLDVLASLFNHNVFHKRASLLADVVAYECRECHHADKEVKCLYCNYIHDPHLNPLKPVVEDFDKKGLLDVFNSIATLPSPTFETFMGILKEVRPLALKEAETKRQETPNNPAA